MQAEETALFAGFHHQPGPSAELANFLCTVYVNVAVPRKIDQRHFYVVEYPSHRRRGAVFAVMSRRISLPPGRSTLYTLSKKSWTFG